MREGRGESENTIISISYVPLPLIPSRQGRGNLTFYETVKVDASNLFSFFCCLYNFKYG